MHEGVLMQRAVAAMLEQMQQAGGIRVTNVQLEVGISGHMSEAGVRQYFEALTRGTPIEEATLEIVWLPATCWCPGCQSGFERCVPGQAGQVTTCPGCGELALEVEHVDACSLREIDVICGEESLPHRGH